MDERLAEECFHAGLHAGVKRPCWSGSVKPGLFRAGSGSVEAATAVPAVGIVKTNRAPGFDPRPGIGDGHPRRRSSLRDP